MKFQLCGKQREFLFQAAKFNAADQQGFEQKSLFIENPPVTEKALALLFKNSNELPLAVQGLNVSMYDEDISLCNLASNMTQLNGAFNNDVNWNKINVR